MKRQIKMGAISYAKMVKLMMEGIYNSTEIAEMTGLHYTTVLQYSRELHREGAAHICAWDKDSRGRDVIKIYKIGEGKDAKRQVQSRTVCNRRYRAKRNHIRMSQALSGAIQEQT